MLADSLLILTVAWLYSLEAADPYERRDISTSPNHTQSLHATDRIVSQQVLQCEDLRVSSVFAVIDRVYPSLELHDLCHLYRSQVVNCAAFPFIRPLFILFSPVSVSTPNCSMDFTFGGKYHLEEELAIGGCGSFLPFFCFVFSLNLFGTVAVFYGVHGLESLSYMLVYFLRGTLPWRKLKAATVAGTWDLICDAKLSVGSALHRSTPRVCNVA